MHKMCNATLINETICQNDNGKKIYCDMAPLQSKSFHGIVWSFNINDKLILHFFGPSFCVLQSDSHIEKKLNFKTRKNSTDVNMSF
jgi:uncharacterized UPF0160 family protein